MTRDTESPALHALCQIKTMLAIIRHSPALKGFFSVAFLLLVSAAIYMIRNRKKFFSYTGDPGDTYASANLRMWMVILVLIHAIAITAIMIFEV
jgi:hypothetical protein